MTTQSLSSKAQSTAGVAKNQTLASSIASIALFVLLLSASAWIKIPVGPVPVTLQTLVVFLAAAILGPKRGTIAVTSYIALGFVGLPLFSGFIGGSAAIMGATGGYIVGFILSTVVTGAIIQKFGKRIHVMALAMLAGLAICYAFGTIWFVCISGADMFYVMSVCVAPFIVPDAIKIALSISVVKLLGALKTARA